MFFQVALCVCFLVWLPDVIECQAPFRGAADEGIDGVDAPAEPVLIEKEEMEKEMEMEEVNENRRKLEEDNEFEVFKHDEDEGKQEKKYAKQMEDLKVQVNFNLASFRTQCSLYSEDTNIEYHGADNNLRCSLPVCLDQLLAQ